MNFKLLALNQLTTSIDSCLSQLESITAQSPDGINEGHPKRALFHKTVLKVADLIVAKKESSKSNPQALEHLRPLTQRLVTALNTSFSSKPTLSGTTVHLTYFQFVAGLSSPDQTHLNKRAITQFLLALDKDQGAAVLNHAVPMDPVGWGMPHDATMAQASILAQNPTLNPDIYTKDAHLDMIKLFLTNPGHTLVSVDETRSLYGFNPAPVDAAKPITPLDYAKIESSDDFSEIKQAIDTFTDQLNLVDGGWIQFHLGLLTGRTIGPGIAFKASDNIEQVKAYVRLYQFMASHFEAIKA